MTRQRYTQTDAFTNSANDLPLFSQTPVNVTLPAPGRETIKAKQLSLEIPQGMTTTCWECKGNGKDCDNCGGSGRVEVDENQEP